MRLILTLFLVHSAFAASAQSLMERLIAEAWLPNQVRVEWTFSGQIPAQLEKSDDWKIADPMPTRFAGSMNLKLFRNSQSGQNEQVIVSGRARIFGTAFTVKNNVPTGGTLIASNLDTAELEWTLLSSDPINTSSFPENMLAAKTLVAGRPISQNDLRPVPVVKRGQQVNLEYRTGSVKVVLTGRALLDGAVGESIPVAVDLGKEKRYQGLVQSNGLVKLVL
jgi:flagella basal body P-ring formation protein FlgA